MLRRVFLPLIVALAFFLAGGHRPARAQTPTPPDMPPLPQGLEPPPTVYPPTEIYLGAYTYYQVCMACHGDRGQGLTDEWRGMLDEPDQNCWQSKCHHSNHPLGGFVFPTYVPPVTGPLMLARFQTGLDLHDYIRAKMPFQAPGSRSDEEYWQLTAFLLKLNGVDPGIEPLTAERASAISLGGVRPAAAASPAAASPAAAPTPTAPDASSLHAAQPPARAESQRARAAERTGALAAIGLLLAAGAILLVFLRPSNRPST